MKHTLLRPAERARAARLARARRATDFQVLRYVEGSSPLHHLWAGTKLVSLAALSIAIVLRPSWQTAGVVGALILLAYLVARLPRGVVPHVPRWIWIAVVISCLISLLSGGAPFVHLSSHWRVGLGGLALWARFSVVGLEVLAMAGLIGWTTPLADLAPAMGRLAAPLRRVKVPVDELVAVIALSIRCLPLLLDEARVLAAARRARRTAPHGVHQILEETEHLVFAALSSALRRSKELAEAIEARGGVPTVTPETHRVRWTDAVTLAVTAGSLAVIGLLH